MQDTITIKTPVDQQEVIIKGFITGREKRELRNVFLKNVTLQGSPSGQTFSDLKASIVVEAENKAIEIVVISVAGKTEDKLDSVLNMKAEDYDFVMAKINEVTSDAEFSKKKVT